MQYPCEVRTERWIFHTPRPQKLVSSVSCIIYHTHYAGIYIYIIHIFLCYSSSAFCLLQRPATRGVAESSETTRKQRNCIVDLSEVQSREQRTEDFIPHLHKCFFLDPILFSLSTTLFCAHSCTKVTCSESIAKRRKRPKPCRSCVKFAKVVVQTYVA